MDRRGVVTGLVQFSRTIGGAVGVGVLGGILTTFVGAASSAVLDPSAVGSISPDQLRADAGCALRRTHLKPTGSCAAIGAVALVVAVPNAGRPPRRAGRCRRAIAEDGVAGMGE